MRIAFGRIAQESHGLSPVRTTLRDFESLHLLDGAALMKACEPNEHEMKGLLKNAELSGFVAGARTQAASTKSRIELVPLISAWAIPSGPLTRDTFEELVERLVAPLRTTTVDAVFLSLHGAMGVAHLPLDAQNSADAEIVARVRAVVGDAVPIAVTLDLHANVCQALVDHCTIIQAYRTNPHRDHADVGARCGRLLVKTLRKEIQPTMAWRSLPMFLGGGSTIDFLRPMRSIFKHMNKLESAGALGASVCMCHPWNNHPELGWSVLVVTDGSVGAAHAAADSLAELCWNARLHQTPTFVDPQTAIERARKATFLRRIGVVVMADTSDVTTAGAPGENTRLLRELVAARDLKSLSAVRDPALVDELHRTAKPGDLRDVAFGNKLDPDRGERFSANAEIVRIGQAHGLQRFVVLRIENAHVVVVEGPAIVIRPSFFRLAGLSVWRADVVVVKNFFPFLMYFLPYSRKNIFVRSKGITDLDAANELQFAGAVFPKDDVSEWQTADQRRRQVRSMAAQTDLHAA
jgi:microcystin degradation protein MlrC